MKRYIPAALALTLLFTGPAPAEEKAKATPITAEAAANLAEKPITGKVLEVQSAGGYTYLLIKNEQGEVWTALPESKVEAGQDVVVSPGMMMKSFESKALGKTFDVIIFSSGLAQAGDMHPATATAGDTPHASEKMQTPVDEAELEKLSGGSARAVVPADKIKVEKAEGKNAQTVVDCFANAEQLNNKTVQVRGKVMKFSSMIMGKNWIHLQDGTGDPEKKTHDLVVTTSGKAKKGAVVTVEGILHKDKDFGAGYRYAAIIEEAKVLE